MVFNLPPKLTSPAVSKTLSTLAGIPVGHYELFKFSLASEAVLPDNCIVPATPLPTELFKFSLASEAVLPDNCIVPATPLPTMCIGTGYGNSVCPSGTAR